MFDLIIGPLLEYGPLGDLNKTSINGKDEVWYNSKTDITFGDTTTWLIGLGRMTNISGPDLKVVADWSFIFDLIPEPTNKVLRLGKSLLFGAGGATDLILGGKDSLNYGHTQDISIVRKKEPPLEVKIFGKNPNRGEKFLPNSLLLLIILPYLVLLTIVVTSRLAYMQVGKFSEKNVRDQVRGALNMSAPLIESRWVACLILFEKLSCAKDVVQKNVNITLKLIEDTVTINQVALRNALLLPDNTLITQNIQDQIENVIDGASVFNENQSVAQQKAFKESADLIKMSLPKITFATETENKDEYKYSTTNLHSNHYAVNYNAQENISLKVAGQYLDDKLTSLELLSDNAYLSAPDAKINIGTIGSKGKIEIKSSHKDGQIVLSSENIFSTIMIKNQSLTIRSGSVGNQTPTIALAEGSLMIRCGPAQTGPKILFNNDQVMITAGNRLARTGPKFVMTNDGIELAVGAGPDQSALKISSAGIEIKSGATASTTWNADGIDMKAAENAIKIGLADLKKQAIMLKENIDAVAKIKSVLSNLDVSGIDDLKAALRNL